MGGFDNDGAGSLWLSDPSGTYSSWKAYCTGRNAKTVNEWLEKNYGSCDTAEDDLVAIKLAIRGLQEVVEQGDNNIDIAVMRRGAGLERLPAEELKRLIVECDKERKEEEEKAKKAAGAAATGRK